MPRKNTRSTFGSVRALPSGSAQARYVGPDMKRHVRTFAAVGPDRRQAAVDARKRAQRWLADESRRIEDEQWTPPPKAGARVEEAAKAHTVESYGRAWIAGRLAGHLGGRPMKQRTAEEYERILDRYLVPAFGDRQLRWITPDDVESWFDGLLLDAPTMRAHTYAFLRTLFAAAVADRKVPEVTVSPCQMGAAGKVHRHEKQHETVTLTQAEVSDLAAAMPEHLRALVWLSALCCLRFGEAVALRRRDIDWRAGVVHVRGGIVRTIGGRVRDTPKNHQRRVVHMLPGLRPVLERHLDQHVAPGPDAPLFPGTQGGFLSSSTLYGKNPSTGKDGRRRPGSGFYGARAAVGHPGMHWHDLRHTGATLAAQSGATTRELMDLLGHSTPAMAMHYQHVAAGRMSSLAERMSESVPWPAA